MAYQHLSENGGEYFSTPGDGDIKIVLNTNKEKFLLISHPGISEIRQAIEEYAQKRLESSWHELMQEANQKKSINAFALNSGYLVFLSEDIVNRVAKTKDKASLRRFLRSMTIPEQRKFAQAFKPKNLVEMLALYRDTHHDTTGYRYFIKVLEASESAHQFFGKLTDDLFAGFGLSDYTIGTPRISFHQPRILEFLGMSLARNWILFPFLSGESQINSMRALMHGFNTRRYLHPTFGPPQAQEISESIRELTAPVSTYNASAKYVERLVICSTYRSIAHTSAALFNRCISLVDNGRDLSYRPISYARRGYNALIKLHCTLYPKAPRQPELTKAKTEKSLTEFASFHHIILEAPHLQRWSERMSEYVISLQTSPAAGQFRKTVCCDFLEFLKEYPNPPNQPELTNRALINNFTEQGNCFRTYLSKKYNLESCNAKLSELSGFFDFIQQRIKIEFTGEPKDSPWFPNPVDMRFDRFKIAYRAGTKRKAIAANILKEMRKILIENDYSWSKQWDYDWTHLVDEDTKTLQYVWCPSSAIALYVLLSIPLRGLQTRILDSGEGDEEIFDFQSAQMIPNPNQLPVNGKIERKRAEGFIQLMPSGLTFEPEIVGLWICVNKTSDEGYAIPWISDELLHHLQYQRDWIFRFSPHPNTHSIEEAQGHRNTPEEWLDKQQQFFCLFRDPSAERIPDKSLPVSKQKLLKLWGRLCLETQKRMNENVPEGVHRIRLVKPGTEADKYPIAIHDLHTLRVSGITDLLDRGVPLNIVAEYMAGHATFMMTLRYDKPAPGMMRRILMDAHLEVGDTLGALPDLTEDEIGEMKPFLLYNSTFEGSYTGFDALEDNIGLIQVRQSGICPGTRCEEGGLTTAGRAEAVPAGDRGPSCPQCRFWITGPAFLLGQAIEGNQLILKIRQKVKYLAQLRENILDSEDNKNFRESDILRSKTDLEERQLNNMLTEWWHRMRFYERSIEKLDEYRLSLKSKSDSKIILLRHSHQEPNFGYNEASELELKHFISTCAEALPEFVDESINAPLDIELAVGRFLAINNENEITSLFFKLSDSQRLTAANLTVELLLHTCKSPIEASDLLEGKTNLLDNPQLKADISKLYQSEFQKISISSKISTKPKGKRK